MRTSIISLLFLFTISLNIHSQCQPPGALDCESAYVFCSLDEMDGFWCSNIDQVNPTGPSPLCPGVGGVPHNTSWWGFVGNGQYHQVTFVLTADDCMNRQGLQAGILDDCDGWVSDCDANCNVENFTLSFQTENGHTYYIWVDGCNADVCDFSIWVNGGGPVTLPRPLPTPELVGRACPCGRAEVCIEDLAEGCEPKKQWTIDGVDQSKWDDESCVRFDIIENGGPIEVCVTWIIGNPSNPSAICDEETKCVTIYPDSVELINDGEIFVCWEDHKDAGYNWRDTTIYNSCVDPPCKVRRQDFDNCCVDYFSKITFLPEREVHEAYKFICDKSDLPYKTENGQRLYKETCDKEITWQDKDYHNCDTTYILHMAVFDPKVKITQTCGDCDQLVTLKANVKYSSQCMMGDLSWTGWWLNDVLDTIGMGDSIVVDDDGDYIFNMEVTYKDITNNISENCQLSDPSWHYIVKNMEITTPKLNRPAPTCDQPIVKHFLQNSYHNVCAYNWVIKNGIGKIVTPNPEDASRISVDWTGLKSIGTLCVNVVTDCSITKDSCIDFHFSSQKVRAINDSIICGSEAIIDHFSSPQTDQWTFISGPGKATISSDDQGLSFKVDSFGIYKFRVAASIDNCHSIDTINLHFVDIPKWSDVTFQCDEVNQNYRIFFYINTGDASSLTVIEKSGNRIFKNNKNRFTTSWMKNGESSSISISDRYFCPTISLDTVFDCMDVAVNDVSTFGIHIFPNPTSDFIQIMGDDNSINLYEMQINIIDVHGKVVVAPPKSDISGGVMIDLKKMTSGIYFIQLIKGDEMEIFKVIKTGG